MAPAAHRAGVHADHGRPRLRPLRRARRRLGLDRVRERRRPRSRARRAACTSTSSPCRSRPTPTAEITSRTSSRTRAPRRASGAPPAPATRRSRARSRSRVGYGLEDSPAGLVRVDRREVRRVVRRRAVPRSLVHARPVAHQHHRRTGSPRRPRRRRASTTRCARSAAGALPQEYVAVPTGIANFPGEVTRTPAVVGRAPLQRHALDRARPRRALRGDAGARPVRRRRAGRSSAPCAESAPPSPGPRASCCTT